MTYIIWLNTYLGQYGIINRSCCSLGNTFPCNVCCINIVVIIVIAVLAPLRIPTAIHTRYGLSRGRTEGRKDSGAFNRNRDKAKY